MDTVSQELKNCPGLSSRLFLLSWLDDRAKYETTQSKRSILSFLLLQDRYEGFQCGIPPHTRHPEARVSLFDLTYSSSTGRILLDRNAEAHQRLFPASLSFSCLGPGTKPFLLPLV